MKISALHFTFWKRIWRIKAIVNARKNKRFIIITMEFFKKWSKQTKIQFHSCFQVFMVQIDHKIFWIMIMYIFVRAISDQIKKNYLWYFHVKLESWIFRLQKLYGNWKEFRYYNPIQINEIQLRTWQKRRRNRFFEKR
jgi:hypothetical protein